MKRYCHKYCFTILFLALWFWGAGLSAQPSLRAAADVFGRFSLDFRAPDRLYQDLENAVIYSSVLRKDGREIFSAVQVLQQKNEIRNFLYIKDREGFFHWGNLYQAHNDQIGQYARRLRLLRESLPEETPLLFIGAPPRFVYGQTPIYSGYPVDRRSARHMDELMINLFSHRVDTLDLSYTSLSQMPRQQMFYKTDGNWTIQAAFDVFCIIVGELEERYGIQLDPDGFYRAYENYTSMVYPQIMLGAMGKSAGMAFSELEDFTLITPNFDTSLERNILYTWDNSMYRGDFGQALLDYGRISVNADPRDISPYNVYLNGSRAMQKITNLLKPDGVRILLIADGYFAPVCAFLAPLAGEISMVSPTEAQAPDIAQLIETTDYDLILIGCQPSSVNDQFFPYYRELSPTN